MLELLIIIVTLFGFLAHLGYLHLLIFDFSSRFAIQSLDWIWDQPADHKLPKAFVAVNDSIISERQRRQGAPQRINVTVEWSGIDSVSLC